MSSAAAGHNSVTIQYMSIKTLPRAFHGFSPRRSVFREKIQLVCAYFHMFILNLSGRGWGILLDQLLGFQFSPEFGRNPGLHRGIVREDLLFTAGANH